MFRRRTLKTAMLFLALFGAWLGFGQSAKGAEEHASAPASRPTPIVRWTASRDDMNFRYEALKNVKTTALFTAAPETGSYNHHPQVVYFKGVLYVSWEHHLRDENACGQQILTVRSLDQGKTWTPAQEQFPSLDRMVPASDPYRGTRFQTSQGFIVVDDTLYAVTDVCDWTASGRKKGRPRIKIGRLCRSVHADGALGDPLWLLPEAPQPVEGFPAFPAGAPALVEKINQYFLEIGHEIQIDFSMSPHPVSDDNHRMSEPAAPWRLPDGGWVKIYRDNGSADEESVEEAQGSKSQRNYAAFTFDDGKTWTVPTRTNFPDASSHAAAGRLPDGQIYVISNILPMATDDGGRFLLAISLSRDGLNFDRTAVIRAVPPPIRYEGRSKDIGYQYPHATVAGPDLWVVYSVNKEDIEIARIPLSDLEKL